MILAHHIDHINTLYLSCTEEDVASYPREDPLTTIGGVANIKAAVPCTEQRHKYKFLGILTEE